MNAENSIEEASVNTKGPSDGACASCGVDAEAEDFLGLNTVLEHLSADRTRPRCPFVEVHVAGSGKSH